MSPQSQYCYQVAELREFPHCIKVGIYDEPPSLHIEYWNPDSLFHAAPIRAACIPMSDCPRTHKLASTVVPALPSGEPDYRFALKTWHELCAELESELTKLTAERDTAPAKEFSE